jgi:predicted HicB family RNase H-like nuclease
MNLLTYKGYTGKVEVNVKTGTLFGEVLNLRDVITFEADTVADLEREFHASVDEYLAWCARDGVEPEKPYSGQFRLRTTPQRHRMIALAAAIEGKSINSWVDETLAEAASRELAEMGINGAQRSAAMTGATQP